MRLIRILLLSAALLQIGCVSAGAQRRARIDAAIAAATQFLLQHQSEDGAWRSDTYAAFGDGPTLTPLVALALVETAAPASEGRIAVGRARAYLVERIESEVKKGPLTGDPFERPLDYPTYTPALAGLLLHVRGDERERRAGDAWLEYLRRRQLNGDLEWVSSHPQFGGWGYYPVRPRNPKHPDAMKYVGSNISATAYAVDALRYAGEDPKGQVMADALLFTMRCQNFPRLPQGDDPVDPRTVDGGFFFNLTDLARNKAGPLNPDDPEPSQFHSYGSATADGLRILVWCGLGEDHPRVSAARAWLNQRFDVTANPGHFAPDREVLRDGFYFYYCRSLARTLRLMEARQFKKLPGKGHWAATLADALVARQQEDGSWVNVYTDGREDDAIVATAFALEALGHCHASLQR